MATDIIFLSGANRRARDRRDAIAAACRPLSIPVLAESPMETNADRPAAGDSRPIRRKTTFHRARTAPGSRCTGSEDLRWRAIAEEGETTCRGVSRIRAAVHHIFSVARPVGRKQNRDRVTRRTVSSSPVAPPSSRRYRPPIATCREGDRAAVGGRHGHIVERSLHSESG